MSPGYLQYPAIRGAKMSNCVTADCADKNRGEQDVPHLAVEEVQSVVWL